jgi:transposase
MSEYAGPQVVGVDLHRRRSVLVRQSESGERLGVRRIVNDPVELMVEIGKCGRNPRVVVEATYGWYWAVDVLAEAGAEVHLAHPLGVKGFTYRRVKNDVRDAADLADLLRMGRLPEAWIAPPQVRELRELVRHRIKLVHWRSALKASVHAVLAKQGVHLPVSDVFGVRGRLLLKQAPLEAPYRARVNSLCRLIEACDWEIDLAAKLIGQRLAHDPGYQVIQRLPGVGPALAAVFVAEIGDVTRFPGPRPLCSWAGLTPTHRESDTKVHRGRVTKQGSPLLRWAAIEAVQKIPTGAGGWLTGTRDQIAARRGRQIATVAVARKLLTLIFYGLRDGHIRALSPARREAG